MRNAIASLILAAVAGCGGTQHDHENPLVQGSDAPPTCCCKTVPAVSEKEIVPNYAMAGRMECSTQNGTCVDDVQCNGQTAPSSSTNGVPPPPAIGSASDSAVP
jgi:hypothetical protein